MGIVLCLAFVLLLHPREGGRGRCSPVSVHVSLHERPHKHTCRMLALCSVNELHEKLLPKQGSVRNL